MASNSSGTSRESGRLRRKNRTRAKVQGTAERPRLCVFRSSKFTYAQLIADDSGAVIASLSTKTVKASDSSSKCVASAKELGLKVGAIAKEKQISAVVFDRNGFLYHGRIAAVADGAREAGLQF